LKIRVIRVLFYYINHNMRKFIIILISLWGVSKIYAQSSQIDFNIKGLENQNIILACEYGNKQLVVDTIALNNEAKGFYSSKKRMETGIYIVLFPNQKYVELLINDEQFFTVNSDTTNLFGNLTIEGAEETELYRQYLALITDYENLLKLNKVNKSDSSSLQASQKAIHSFTSKIITEKPESFIAACLRMKQDVEMPQNATVKIDKNLFLQKYHYIKDHYFDNVNFADNRLLRTRIISDKLSFYFNVFIRQDADSICHSMDIILKRVANNDEAYKFVLNFLNVNYRNAKTATQEKVLIYLADNYYLHGKAPWADPQFIKVLNEKVETLRPLLVGQKAPNLELQTPDGKAISLYSIDAEYIIVYFWSPDCGHCKTETPKLEELYKRFKWKDVKVLAVYVHVDTEIWKKYIQDNNLDFIHAFDPFLKSNFPKLYSVDVTPKLYILDKDKKIVAKNITVAAAQKFLEKELK
jgi:thiol-disulfide isomerase/thioredoxin